MENDMDDVEDVDVEKLCSLLLNDSDDSPPGKHSNKQLRSANQAYLLANSSDNVSQRAFSSNNWDSQMRSAYPQSHWEFADVARPGMSPTAATLGIKTGYLSSMGETVPRGGRSPMPAPLWTASDAESLLASALPMQPSPQVAWRLGHDGRQGNLAVSSSSPLNPPVGAPRHVPAFPSPLAREPSLASSGLATSLASSGLAPSLGSSGLVPSLASSAPGYGIVTAAGHAQPAMEEPWVPTWSPDVSGPSLGVELPLNRPWEPSIVPVTAQGSGTFAMWPASGPPAVAGTRAGTAPPRVPVAERGTAPLSTSGGGMGLQAGTQPHLPSLPGRGGSQASPSVPASSAPRLPVLGAIRVPPPMLRPIQATVVAGVAQPAAGSTQHRVSSTVAANKPAANRVAAASNQMASAPAVAKSAALGTHPGTPPVAATRGGASWQAREDQGGLATAAGGPASVTPTPSPTAADIDAAPSAVVKGTTPGAVIALAPASAEQMKAAEAARGRVAESARDKGGAALTAETGGGGASKADMADTERASGMRQVRPSTTPHSAEAAGKARDAAREASVLTGRDAGVDVGADASSHLWVDALDGDRARGRSMEVQRGLASAPEGASTNVPVKLASPGTPGIATSPAAGMYGFYSVLEGADALAGVEGSTKEGAASADASALVDGNSTHDSSITARSAGRWHPATWRAPVRHALLAVAWLLIAVLAYVTWSAVGLRLPWAVSVQGDGSRGAPPYLLLTAGALVMGALLLMRARSAGRPHRRHVAAGSKKKLPPQPAQQAQGLKASHPTGLSNGGGTTQVALSDRASACAAASSVAGSSAAQGGDSVGRKRRAGKGAAPPSSSSGAGGSSHGSAKGSRGPLGLARVAGASVSSSGSPGSILPMSSSSHKGRPYGLNDAGTNGQAYRQALQHALGASPPLRAGVGGGTSKQLLRLRRRSRSSCVGGVLGVSLLALLGWVSLVAFEDGWRSWYERLTMVPAPTPSHHHHHHHHHHHASSRGGGAPAGGGLRPPSHAHATLARPKGGRASTTGAWGGPSRPLLVGDAPTPTLAPSLGLNARTTTSSAPQDKDKGRFSSDDLLQLTVEGLMAVASRGRGGSDPPMPSVFGGPKKKIGVGGGNGPLVRLQRCEDRCYGQCRDAVNPGRECVDACTERCVGPCAPRCLDGCMDRCWDGCVADCTNPCMGHCVEKRDTKVEACMEECEAEGAACADDYGDEYGDDECGSFDIHVCVARCDKAGVYGVCAGVCQEACEDRLGDECEHVCDYPCVTMCDDKCFHSCHGDCLDRCPWDDCLDPCLLHCQEVFDQELGAREAEARPPAAARHDKPPASGHDDKRKNAPPSSKGKDRRKESAGADDRAGKGAGGPAARAPGGAPSGMSEARDGVKSSPGQPAGGLLGASRTLLGDGALSSSLSTALQWLARWGRQGSLAARLLLTGGAPLPSSATPNGPPAPNELPLPPSPPPSSDAHAAEDDRPMGGAAVSDHPGEREPAWSVADEAAEEEVLLSPRDGEGTCLLPWVRSSWSRLLASTRAWLRHAPASVTAGVRQWARSLSRSALDLSSATTSVASRWLSATPRVLHEASRGIGRTLLELASALLRATWQLAVGALRVAWSASRSTVRTLVVSLPSFVWRQLLALVTVAAQWLRSLVEAPFRLAVWAVTAVYHTVYTILAALDLGLTALTVPIMVAVAANTVDQLLLQSAARNWVGDAIGSGRRALMRSPAYLALHSWLWSWLEEEEEERQRKPGFRASQSWRQGGPSASHTPPPSSRAQQPRYRSWRDEQRQKEEAYAQEREWRQSGARGAGVRWREEIDASLATKSGNAEEECARILAAGNHFAVLQVDTTAAAADIKKSWREKALMVHPDKNLQSSLLEDANEAFRKLQQAYMVLSDVTHRAQYEQQLMYEPALFAGGGAGGGGGGPMYGSDDDDGWEMDEEARRFMEEILRQFSQGGECGCANCKGQRARAASARGGKKYGKKKQRSKGGRPW